MRNKDEIEGKGRQVVGGAKDKVGEWTKDPDLETEGETERAEGEVQEKLGESRRKVGEKVKKVGDRIAK